MDIFRIKRLRKTVQLFAKSRIGGKMTVHIRSIISSGVRLLSTRKNTAAKDLVLSIGETIERLTKKFKVQDTVVASMLILNEHRALLRGKTIY